MVSYIKSDLEFILQQIIIAEAHATGQDLSALVPNSFVPFGLRTVDGSFNNLFPGQDQFGAADTLFPRLTDPDFRDATAGTSYEQPNGLVIDPQPRVISNLIVDQTIANPAAVAAYVDAGLGVLADGSQIDPGTNAAYPVGTLLDLSNVPIPAGVPLTPPNTAPDAGLSASFNQWFVFFGQFFDHGLDLVTKGGNGTVFIPLQPDDPLFVEGSATNFMVLTRATQFAGPGADGVVGDDPGTPLDESADDTVEHENTTSPFVDQNQTYSSHPSHQVFLRAYALNAAGDPVATGELITNRDLGDGIFGNGDDADLGGMATWAVVKAQARDILGINLTDADFDNVPLLATDAYGNFIKGPNGFPQVVMKGGDGIAGTADDVLVEGNPLAPVDLANAVRTGHAFLNDIAHDAVPVFTAGGGDDGIARTADDLDPDAYNTALLDAHYIAGDGRVNENVGLTAVHHVFHSEHNRLVEHTKSVLLSDAAQLLAGGATQAEAVAFLNEWLAADVSSVPATAAEMAGLQWDGERLFQAAKFGTEMQYQHLVFEEFARKVQPNVDPFLAPDGFDTTIDPAIVAEFAHTVYRFGHSMLNELIDRLDPNFQSSEIGLIESFLNPLAFARDENGVPISAEEAAGAIVRGTTRQVGNELDEFVTEALRNNLLGLPLDLAAINIARGRDTGIPSFNAARAEFYAMTSDSQLKPYTSWADFAQHLRHPESLVNFVAAYGTHETITGATTLAEKRAAATLLVLGGDGAPADRLDFLNAIGDFAGGSLGGLNDVDFWIGGLAEEQMPFGGLLGSTFNFVFETQLEALQNGDRFYYLSRTAGMHFATELENNSFAKLIMASTDATHLPADVFSTPAFILEVDKTKQFTGLNEAGPDGIQGNADDVAGADGINGNSDPLGGTALTPLVIRNNPATPGADTNYLQYTGEDHVVLGGTAGDDIMIASIGDDTLWGDGGNDRLEGGYGNDNIEGGAGDDIITDQGGDDVLKGNDGNDVIHGGNGLNLILGGAGSDFIVTGEDVSDTFGGEGNDFILGAQMNLPTFGNEGDDWIEIGTSDGAGGDNFDPQEAGAIIGHDVFITGGGFDEVDGEGGDDIMVGSDGEDHFGGGGGFDWASYEHDQLGVTVDLNVNDLVEPPVTPSASGILDRFAQVEGLSGSAFADILRGDNADTAEIDVNGAQNSALTNIDLIDGLQELLGPGVTRFASGNIILGGDGSDIIEGRGGDDIIDGDRSLNVRVSVRATVDANSDGVADRDANGELVLGDEIRSVESITELVPDMLAGTYNPGQLQIVREILPGDGGFNFDTAVFSGSQQDYNWAFDDNGTPLNFRDDIVTITDSVAGRDGSDRLIGIERLQFSDFAVTLVPDLNAEPVGVPTISDDTPAEGQLLTVSVAGVTDADNPGTGVITGAHYVWQVERDPGAPGVFEDIVDEASGNPATVTGATLTVPADLDGLRLRVKVIYQDANGVLETAFSAPTSPVAAGTALPPQPAALPDGSNVASEGIRLITADLQFILDQIVIAERHAAGEDLADLVANARLPFGLRTVDGSFNNLVEGQESFGASDQDFPTLLDQVFRNEGDGETFDANGPAPGGVIGNTNYATTGSSGNVVDSDPRTISNLIVDQTSKNPAAVAVAGSAGSDGIWDTTDDALNDGVSIIGVQKGLDGQLGTRDDIAEFQFDNVTPDEGLSAPFNAWFTFFGQFFDHGLDLVDKGGNGAVFIPLQPDDPLFNPATPQTNFMVLTRASNTAVHTGSDGVFGTSDDVHVHNNETTPFVDQNQTYTSHASHQVFLREYQLNADGDAVSTGQLIDGENGGIANWAEVKAQAAQLLGIKLTDADIFDVPLLATDAYGNFIPGANGFAQVVTDRGLVEGVAGGLDLRTIVVDGEPAVVGRTGHAFLNDIAHNAAPVFSAPGVLAPDADSDTGNQVPVGPQGNNLAYDNELLDAHFITGDGRGNENIGLTAVHFVFHAEHNRLVDHIKDVVLASAGEGDVSFLNQWLLTPVGTVPANLSTLAWNGERLFQAARFGTEMQYQHLVFEEFARKVQPQVDVFLLEGQGYDTTIDPAIVAEFAHTVYRFGHSMLTETIDRLDPSFNLVNGEQQQIGLVEAFLNPLEFTASGATDAEAAGAIIRGVTRQVGNEIDEFVTETLRNNLLGLPLDLAAINIARGRDTGVPSLNAARAQFHEWTGDSQLKPYASWADFAQHLKHPESLVNFIAAYGTHSSVTGQTTLEGKRAAAFAIVMGVAVTLSNGSVIAAPADRLDFLNAAGTWTGGSLGGLNDVDFWIGGMAEEQMPFGGLLGSTFNYVFENQLEKLQNGDRFYYLERAAAQNFLTELENNSFAKLIMANTDATHLPGDVFSTPAFTLEVDPAKQFTGLNEAGANGIQGDADDVAGADGIQGNSDPVGGSPLTPLVIRNNPATPGTDTNYLQYTGEDHVVLGGTAGNDIIISSIGDDTLYGDGGNDRLEGGDGVDMILGGAGDDIITDQGGEDNLQGGDGNDAIHGGNSIDLILGGFGNDFIVTGEDSDETFGGGGNDFILGDAADEMVFGNEGDDWIEGGMADGSAGENFDVRGLDSIVGNDVFVGSSTIDRMNGEGGDDIMVGSKGGPVDRFIGGSGFDWASFEGGEFAANADLNLRAFDETPVPLSAASALARYESIEGLSGSSRSDILRGDDADAATIANAGARGSVLTNFELVEGLQELVDQMLGAPQTSFGSGNIILGGDGSDIIEGRGGDDLIDGDRALNVRISWRSDPGDPATEIETFTSMTEIAARVFSGEINPGQLVIVREIVSPTTAGPDFDRAVFSDVQANYDIVTVNGVTTVTHLIDDDGDGVRETPGTDGVDRLMNIEELVFSNGTVSLGGSNGAAGGQLAINDGTPTEDQLLTATAALTDVDNVSAANPTGAISGPVSYVWQVESRPVQAPGVFEDIVIATGLGDVTASGTTFRPGDAEVGLRLRLKATFQDANGVIETVFSAATAPVANVNDAPTRGPTISDPTPTEGRETTALTATISDPDGTDTAAAAGAFTFQWQQSGDGGVTWTDILDTDPTDFSDPTLQLFIPTQGQVGRLLRVAVTFTDDGGAQETVFSAATDVVGDYIEGTAAGDTLTGTAGQDEIWGFGVEDFTSGDDILNGLGGNDQLFGGDGNDLFGGGDLPDTGADTMWGGTGDDTYVVENVGDTVVEEPDEGTDSVRTSLAAYTLTANVENLTYTGTGNFTGTGNDLDNVITGNGGNDTLSGGAGNDTLDGRAGADAMTGGAGNDTYVVDSAGDQVIEGSDGGTDTVRSLLNAYALTANVENLTFIGTGNFAGTGNDLDNVITGGGGNDTLDGRAGADRMTGGTGNDIYIVDNAADQVVEGAGGGTDTVRSLLNAYTLTADVENLTFIGEGNFSGTGNGLDNTITGNVGNDALFGGAGGDHLDGGEGSDWIEGGDGNDGLIGGSGHDALFGGAGGDGFIGGEGNDWIEGGDGNDGILGGGGNDALFGGAGGDWIEGGDGTDSLIGGGDADALFGGAGGDWLDGGDGADWVDGGIGSDVLHGITGNDVLVAGAGDDWLDGGDGADWLDSGDGHDALHGAGGNDVLHGVTGNDWLDGGDGEDWLDGGEANDVLLGVTGNDVLVGGGGNDWLDGGAGNDTLVFAAGFGNDVVVGFDADPTGGQDLLYLSALGVTAGTFAGSVLITDVGDHTVVTIGSNTMTLLGVNGVGANTVTQDDFILA